METLEDLIQQLTAEKQNRRIYSLIAKYLMARLQIDPDKDNLVLTIGNRLARSNIQAVVQWVSNECSVIPSDGELLDETLRGLETKLYGILTAEVHPT